MSGSPKKRRALGRGLSALLPATPTAADRATADAKASAGAGEITRLPDRRSYFQAPIEEVHPSPEQPRRRFAERELEELAVSIRAHGIIQPLIVRARPERDGGGYYLIAGERRWRAAQRAGLREVPVVIQEVDSNEAFERALVENLQRSDLNPIEEAEAFLRMTQELGYTQEQIATRVGKERSTIANALRLLKLPRRVRGLVEEGELSMGHARCLLSLESASEIETVSRAIVGKGLSVRAAEALVRSRMSGAGGDRPMLKKAPRKKSAAVRDLETRLTRSLGSAVTLEEDRRGKGGRIDIRYLDLDDLDRLLERLLRGG